MKLHNSLVVIASLACLSLATAAQALPTCAEYGTLMQSAAAKQQASDAAQKYVDGYFKGGAKAITYRDAVIRARDTKAAFLKAVQDASYAKDNCSR